MKHLKPILIVFLPARITLLLTLICAISFIACTTTLHPQPPNFVEYDEPPVPIGGYGAIQRNLVYPSIAQAAGVEGTVVIQAFVDKEGVVTEAFILKGISKVISGFGLDEAAIDAFRKTKFRPAMSKGEPVGVWIAIPVNFRL